MDRDGLGDGLSSSSSTSASSSRTTSQSSQSASASINTSMASSTPNFSPLYSDDERLPGLPLSLQDMCMLHIMLRLEEFPVKSLALLPHKVRRRLFLGLSHADLLHIDVETLFGDLHSASSMDPSNCGRGPAFARKELLDVILCGDPSHFVSLNIKPVLDCFDHFWNLSIWTCFWVLSFSWAHRGVVVLRTQCHPSKTIFTVCQFRMSIRLCTLQTSSTFMFSLVSASLLQHAVCPEWAQGWLLRLSKNNVLEGLPGSPLEKCSNH